MHTKRILITYPGDKDKRLAYAVIWGFLFSLAVFVAFDVVVNSLWQSVFAFAFAFVFVFVLPACMGLTEEVRKAPNYKSHAYLIAAFLLTGLVVAITLSESLRSAVVVLPLLAVKVITGI